MKSRKTRSKDNPEGQKHFQKALSLWDEGKIEEALAEFKRAVEHGLRNDSIENDIGACLERLGLVEEARKHYSEAIRLNPYNFYALKNMGLSLLIDDQFQQVEDCLEKCLVLDPSDNEVRIALARAEIALGKPEKAIKLVKPVASRSESLDEIIGAMQVLFDAGAYVDLFNLREKLPEEVLSSSEALQILGEACFELGFGEESIGYFRKLVERNPDPISKSWLGLALMSSGYEEEGLRILKEAEAEGGNDVRVLQNLAFALHGSERLEEALEVYRRATEIAPDDWVLWNNWGNALYNLGRLRESLPKFVMALEKNPDYQIAWNNIGNALEKMGLHEESLPFHLRAIEIDDTFAYAHYAAGIAYQALGKFELAEAEFKRTIELRPTFSEIWIARAKTKLLTAPEEALALSEKAVEIDPTSIEANILLGISKSLVGMNEESEIILRRARALAADQKDERAMGLIDELLEKGPTRASRLKEMLDVKLVDEKEMPESPFEDLGDSAYWYRLGSTLLSRNKRARALDAFRISWEIDPHSSATLAMLLRYETNAVRLREYIGESERLRKIGLSTPELERAVELAGKRLGKLAKGR
jgi:tetratricopeptide (TPR) repeat protein